MLNKSLLRVRDALAALSGWDRLLCAICGATILFSLLQLALLSFGRDQSIYALVAREMSAGGVPYRDVWDFKPPGIFFVYWLAQVLFGEDMLAPRLLEMLSVCAMGAGFLYLAHQLLGSWLAGLMATALAALLHVQLEFWHTGQPESFGATATVLALACVVTEPRSARGRLLTPLLAGVLFGFAFLFKPPLGGSAVLAVAYLLRKGGLEGKRPRLLLPTIGWMTAGALLPIAVCASWFVGQGGWAALRWTFAEFTPGYTKLGWEYRNAFDSLYYAVRESLLKFSLLVPFGIAAMVATRNVHTREREAIFLVAGTALVQLCGVALQAKFFPYHYGATIPLLAWLGSIGLYKLWLRARRGLLTVVIFLSSAFALVAMRTGVRDIPGTFWERSLLRTQYALGRSELSSRAELDAELYRAADFNLAADRQVGEVIERSTLPSARVFVWGFEPAIYWFARRPIASRFIYNVPQRATWQREYARRSLLQELQALPDLIVVQHNDVFPFVTGDELDSALALNQFPELADLITQNYVLSGTVEDFDLYRPSDTRYAAARP
jgi:hypothetical protein